NYVLIISENCVMLFSGDILKPRDKKSPKKYPELGIFWGFSFGFEEILSLFYRSESSDWEKSPYSASWKTRSTFDNISSLPFTVIAL
ncbi:hypothetical protein, partial [Algoriphagus sp.]|uniref:hypothetical protein n=1 Tax=Algoriphagus sp. TaxID=1872435 RepID=UPI002602CA2A